MPEKRVKNLWFCRVDVVFLTHVYISLNKKLWIAEGRICFHRSNAPNSDADWSIHEKIPLDWEYPRNKISELWCCKNTNNLDTFFSIFAENGSPLRMNYTLSLTKISQVKSSLHHIHGSVLTSFLRLPDFYM